MTKHLWSLLIGAVATALAGAAGGGCAAENVVPPKAEIAPLPAGSFAIAWRAQLTPERDTLAELHLTDENVYAYTRNHVSYSVDRDSGALAYITPINTSGGVLRPPVVLSNNVVFPSASTLEVYDKAGLFQRSVPLPYPTRSPGVGVQQPGKQDLVVIGLDYPRSGRAAAVSIDQTYGNIVWELLTFGGVSAKPAVYEQVLYIGSEDGRVYAVGPNREAHWSLEGGVYVTDDRIVADLAADAAGVYVASMDSKLYSIDRASGKTKWQYFGGSALTDKPHVTEDSVYIYVPGRGVVAIDKTEGNFNRQARWQVRHARQFLSADDRNVYLRRRDNAIIAVDKETGEVKFTSKTRDYDIFASNTLTNDGTIYAADKAGIVVAIRPVLSAGVVGEIVKVDPVRKPSAARLAVAE